MKSTNIKVNGYTLYVNPNTKNAKVGSRGTSLPLAQVYGLLPKGQARKLRKSLRSAGMPSLAAIPTQKGG